VFAPIGSNTTYLIDKCGKQVKTWPIITNLDLYLFPDGSLLDLEIPIMPLLTQVGKGVIEK
jgi:hypothetical protein